MKVIKFENQGEKIEELINNVKDYKSPTEIVNTFIKIYEKYGGNMEEKDINELIERAANLNKKRAEYMVQNKQINKEIREIIKYLRNQDILGMKGICSDCGKEGTYCYEPYYAEIHEEKYLICLCEDCKTERYQNI